MNLIDLFLLLSFIGILFLGFSQGMIRITILLVTFYLSVVLAILYFQPVGDFFQDKFDSSRNFAYFTGFTVALLVSYAILASAGLYTFRYAKIPGQFQYVDRIIGTLLAIILAVLLLGMFAVIMAKIRWSGVDLPIAKMLQKAVRTSQLLTLFKLYLLPGLYGYVQPILPPGADYIFSFT